MGDGTGWDGTGRDQRNRMGWDGMADGKYRRIGRTCAAPSNPSARGFLRLLSRRGVFWARGVGSRELGSPAVGLGLMI